MYFRDAAKAVIEHRDGLVVLTEWGFEHAKFWLTPFSAEALESWWLAVETFESPEQYELTKTMAEALKEEPPPPKTALPPQIPGHFLSPETDPEWELWWKMEDSHDFYFAHFCCDSDSFLRRPDGTRLYHPGFEGDRA